jgi:hypothetical protein
MCSPPIIEQVKKRITRRNLFDGMGATGYRTSSEMGPCLIFEI